MTLCPVPWVVRVRLNWAQSTQRGSWFHARILSPLIFESSCEIMLMDNRQRGIERQLENDIKEGKNKSCACADLIQGLRGHPSGGGRFYFFFI